MAPEPSSVCVPDQKDLNKNNQFTEQRVRQSLKTHLIGPESQTPSLLLAAEVVALAELVEPVEPVELVEPVAVAVQELEPFQTEKRASNEWPWVFTENRDQQNGATHIYSLEYINWCESHAFCHIPALNQLP